MKKKYEWKDFSNPPEVGFAGLCLAETMVNYHGGAGISVILGFIPATKEDHFKERGSDRYYPMLKKGEFPKDNITYVVRWCELPPLPWEKK